jgi:reverse gyrase
MIVESPAKAEKIQRFLGSNYEVRGAATAAGSAQRAEVSVAGIADTDT